MYIQLNATESKTYLKSLQYKKYWYYLVYCNNKSNSDNCLKWRTIASKINGTTKSVRISLKLQHSVMKLNNSNKFDLCYYGQ